MRTLTPTNFLGEKTFPKDLRRELIVNIGCTYIDYICNDMEMMTNKVMWRVFDVKNLTNINRIRL